MPPFRIGDIYKFVLIHHHPDMEADNQFHLFQGGFRAGLYRFQVGEKIVGYFKTDGLQDFRFGLNVIIETGCLHPHIFGEVPHGCRAEAFLTEKLGGFFDDNILFTAILFASDLCHFGSKDRQLYTC